MAENETSVTFTTPDGGNKTVTKAMAELSLMIKRMMELYCDDNPLTEAIPLLKVNSSTLNCLVDWMRRKVTSNSSPPSSGRSRESHHISDERYDGVDSRLSEWERNFFVNLSRKHLFQLMNAANYMEIPSLIQSGSHFISERIAGLDLDQIRSYMNIERDFTPEEEASLKRQYDWMENVR